MNTITFGEWVGCFFVIFIHLIENSGGYFYWCRLFLWFLDINLQNFARGYFSKFSLRGLNDVLQEDMELEMIMKKVEMSEDLLKMKKAVYVKEMLREQGSI